MSEEADDSSTASVKLKRKTYEEELKRFAKTEEGKAGMVSNVPLKRAGRPEEIAQAIVFVSSDKASFITGAAYPVDGGKSAR